MIRIFFTSCSFFFNIIECIYIYIYILYLCLFFNNHCLMFFDLMFFNMSTLKKKACWTAKWQWNILKRVEISMNPWFHDVETNKQNSCGFRWFQRGLQGFPHGMPGYVLSVVHVLDYVPFWGRLEKGASTERSADFDDHFWLGGLGLWLNITKFYGFNQGSWFVTRFSSRHNQGWPPKKRTRDQGLADLNIGYPWYPTIWFKLPSGKLTGRPWK